MVEEKKRSRHKGGRNSPKRKKSSGSDSTPSSPASLVSRGSGSGHLSNRLSPTRMSRRLSRSMRKKEFRRGFFGGKKLAGQLGFNPFILCSGCCDGTCTVQHGCVILGIVQMVLGFYVVLYCVMKIWRPDAKFVLTTGRCVNALPAQLGAFYKEVKARQHAVAGVGSAVFGYSSGILLLYAAIKLNRIYTAIHCFIAAVGIIFYFIAGTYFMNQDVDLNLPTVDCNWQTDNRFRIMLRFYFFMFIQSYCFCCSYALHRQIRSGVHGNGRGGVEGEAEWHLEAGLKEGFIGSQSFPRPRQQSTSSMEKYLAGGETNLKEVE